MSVEGPQGAATQELPAAAVSWHCNAWPCWPASIFAYFQRSAPIVFTKSSPKGISGLGACATRPELLVVLAERLGPPMRNTAALGALLLLLGCLSLADSAGLPCAVTTGVANWCVARSCDHWSVSFERSSHLASVKARWKRFAITAALHHWHPSRLPAPLQCRVHWPIVLRVRTGHLLPRERPQHGQHNNVPAVIRGQEVRPNLL